jgi:hypothetical protein
MKPNLDCRDVFGQNLSSESFSQEGVWLFPNPATHQIQVRVPTGETAEISMWDMRGRLVLKHTPQDTEQVVLPQEIANGIYMVRLNTNHGFRATRLLIQR